MIDDKAVMQQAYRLGFLRCAGWAQRDDLFADVDSPTYKKDCQHDLSAIAQPAQTDIDPMRKYVEDYATSSGWDSTTSENAFEFIQRISYAQGREDGAKLYQVNDTPMNITKMYNLESMTPVDGFDEIYNHYSTSFGRTPDAFMVNVVKETKQRLIMWWGTHREEIRAALVNYEKLESPKPICKIPHPAVKSDILGNSHDKKLL